MTSTRRSAEREQWLEDHPRATPQLHQLDGQVNRLDNENDHERWTVEGELNPRPAPTPRIERSRSRATMMMTGPSVATTTVTTGSACSCRALCPPESDPGENSPAVGVGWSNSQ